MLIAALAAAAVRAEEPASEEPAAEAPPAREAEVRFVPPGVSGTVSLGIYDASGRLVRVLSDEWTFGRFRIGLNGLSTTWDGRGDDGQPVPAGTYAVRGYVVGDVQVSGEAYHFNDWIESPDSPRIERVASAQLLPGGDVLLIARLAGATGALVRYSPESEARWNTVVSGPRPEPAKSAQLATAEKLAFVLLDGHLQAVSLEDGKEVALAVPSENVKAVAARGDRLAVLDDRGLHFHVLPSFAPQGEVSDLPSEFVSIGLLDQGAVAAAADGAVWRWQAGWSKLEMPEDVKVRSLSGGRGNTFWTLEERVQGVLFVAQYSAEEGRLAEWAAEEGRIVSVAGTPEKDYFVAVLDTADGQRTAGIRRRDGDGAWEFVFDKKITRCADFGWMNSALSASSNGLPEELTVEVAENPLDPEASRSLTLRAVAGGSGTGLATTDGLPLLRISGEPGYGRVMMVEGNTPGTARFFQGDGASVEEYSIGNLADITAFDAGTIEMTVAQKADPAPAEDVGVEE